MKNKVRSALFQQALLRWENAVLIAAGILLTAFLPEPLPFWPVWGWGALALVGVIAITLTSLSERQVQVAAIDDVLYGEYDPNTLKTPVIKAGFLKGLQYRRNIEQIVYETPDGVIRTRLNDLSDKVNQWTGYIYQLSSLLDDYQRDPMLARDPSTIQAEIVRLQADLARHVSPEMVQESQNLIDSKKKFLQSSAALKQKMQAAGMQFEQSLDAMATVYTQLKLIETRDLESFNTQAIDHDIDEQVGRMNDLIDGLQRAYQEGKV